VAGVGQTVTVSGSGFLNATAVKFSNNINANFTTLNDSSITATVPAGASSGPISVSKAGCADAQSTSISVCPTLPVVPAVDDGGAETALGFSTGPSTSVWVNRLTPSSYPATLTAVLSTINLPSGTGIKIVAGVNPGGGTNIDNTITQTIPATVSPQGSFAYYPVTPVTINSGDFVVGFSFVPVTGTFPAWLDQTPPSQGRSYLSTNGTNFSNLDSINFPSNLLVRAEVFPGTCPAATPTPKTVQFSSASYNVSETGPRVDITLTRSGDTTSAASVNFATNDAASLQNCNVFNGIASPRCDYSNTIGTATWAAGDATSKTFSIAIVDDAYAEGNETFTIGLNTPSGATLGTQATATVTITDNDGVNGANPIDSTGFFVRQQYIDFLGREPDPPGFAGWSNTINNCSGDTTQCDRIHVSQLFFQSAEFQDRGYFVYRFYPVAFGRKPDYSEFVPDLASVSGFLDANQLEAAKVAFINTFMARPAFANTYNPLTNQQYVDMLLNTAGVTLSNRQAMIDGLNNATMTRAVVLRMIVESTAVSSKYNHQAYAVMEYFGYLRRQPDGFYLQWIQVLDSTNDPRGMVTGFATSAEYRQRFGP